MIALLLLGLLLTATTAFLLARAAAAPRTQRADRIDEIQSYGFGGEPVAVGVTAPARVPGRQLVTRIGTAVARRIGRVSEPEMRAELMAAGMYGTTPATLLGYRVMSAVGLGAFTVVAGLASEQRGLFVGLTAVAVAAGWMLPLVSVRRRAARRQEEIDRELPDLIDLLVVTIEAGLGFSGSLRVAAREFDGPLGDELRLTLQEQAMGLAVNDALANLLRRSDTPAMRSFVRSVVQGETLGVSIGTIMRNLAVEMRKRRRQRAEERAQKAPVKILFPLVLFIFPTLFIVLLVPALFQLADAFS